MKWIYSYIIFLYSDNLIYLISKRKTSISAVYISYISEKIDTN